MMNYELREELKRIQVELKKPLLAKEHEIRDLPGGGKWIYLRWQTIRNRLDEVCPEWSIDYSEIQYLGNDAIGRGGITILGIRKEALGCVPIQLLSKSGNDMARGSACDRLAAEILKNCGEQWGVGRYLDDQASTYKYLWEHRHELDDEMQGELQKLKNQHSRALAAPQPRRDKEGSVLHDLAGTSSTLVITENQRKRLWAVGKNEYKLTNEQIKAAYQHFGFKEAEAIAANKYDAVMSHMKAMSQQLLTNFQNNAVIKTLLEVLGFDQKRFDGWFAQKYPGMTADMLSPDEMGVVIRSICKSYAQERKNNTAEQVIDHVVVGQFKSGVAIADALNDWKGRYFLAEAR